MASPLWTPSPERVRSARLTGFLHEVQQEHAEVVDYDSLWRWSIQHTDAFWARVWQVADVAAHTPYEAVRSEVTGPGRVPRPGWFPGARLSFAENLLRPWRDSERIAIHWRWENGDTRTLSGTELWDQVARFRRFLAQCGVSEGDRVAGFVPNVPEAVVAMLAANSLGAVWSSCSPDFGFRGVMDRFGQIRPKVLLAADGYRYNGKPHSCLDRVAQVAENIDSIEQIVIIDLLGGDHPHTSWAEATAEHAPLAFAPLPFDHPLYILYSSGTTGVPKCIVHGQGGTLLQHAKEHLLHGDLRDTDVLFYFTTCGWMMWNWLVSGLMAGAPIVLYEGSPSHPGLHTLWDMASALGVTVFGTSPKFLGACESAGLVPREGRSLSLRSVLSTGAPLSPERFAWVYDNIGADLQLASISGGTDIVSCFMLGSPIDAVYAGQIQKRGLGMAVAAWSLDGEPLVGEKGELVCTEPFPSMPIAFWNDPDGERYHSAYFGVFEGVWRHGDYVEITPEGGVLVYGRSDATLNPGGVRIGTAEIYRIVEGHDAVVDSLVVGLPAGDDVEVVLYVVLRDGQALDETLTSTLRTAIRKGATPRHVPARVLQCPAVPRTISGKKVEIAVARVLQGEDAPNRDALANPEALDFFAP